MSMKRQHWLFVLALVIAITGLFANGFIATGLTTTMQDIEVFVNDVRLRLDDPPFIQEGRTLVPMRAFFEVLGADVSWNAETRTAIGTRDGIEVRIPIGSKQSTVNGQAMDVDVPAQIVNGRTFIPLRFVGEALGDEVGWDGDTRRVLIHSWFTAFTSTMPNNYFVEPEPFTSDDFDLFALRTGMSEEKVIERLGEPLSVKEWYNNIYDAGLGKELLYDGLRLIYSHSKLEACVIDSPAHVGPRGVRVGDRAETVLDKYYRDANRDPGVFNNPDAKFWGVSEHDIELYFLEVDWFVHSGVCWRNEITKEIEKVLYSYYVPEKGGGSSVTFLIENGLVREISISGWYGYIWLVEELDVY